MIEINIPLLKLEAKRLEQKVALIQSQLDEINQLIALAEKIMPTLQASTPFPESTSALAGSERSHNTSQGSTFRRATGAGALQALRSTIAATAARTKRAEITETVKEILADGQRRTSRYLVSALTVRGVVLSGVDESKKAGTLSSYLSHDDRFASNVKAGGWMLKSAAEEKQRMPVSLSMMELL